MVYVFFFLHPYFIYNISALVSPNVGMFQQCRSFLCILQWFLWILSVSFLSLQIALFTYYSLTVGPAGLSTPIPAQSIFIFNPGHKFEIWRYFSYFLVHNGWLHLGFNIVIQLCVGLPLEMLHGSWRIGFVYIAAVIAGKYRYALLLFLFFLFWFLNYPFNWNEY